MQTLLVQVGRERMGILFEDVALPFPVPAAVKIQSVQTLSLWIILASSHLLPLLHLWDLVLLLGILILLI